VPVLPTMFGTRLRAFPPPILAPKPGVSAKLPYHDAFRPIA